MLFTYRDSEDYVLIGSWLKQWERDARPTNDEVIAIAQRYEAGLYAQQILAEKGPFESKRQADYEWIAEDGELARTELVAASIGYAVKYSLQNGGVFSLDFNAASKVIDYAIEKYDYTKSKKFSGHVKSMMKIAIERQDRFDDPTFDWSVFDESEDS